MKCGLIFMVLCMSITEGRAGALIIARDSTVAGDVNLVTGEDSLAESSSGNLVSPDSELSAKKLKSILTDETTPIPPEDRNWHNDKNAGVAMLCSLLLPGLGQMYNERPIKAVIACGLEVFYLHQILHNRKLSIRERKIRDSYDKNTDRYKWIEHDWWSNEYKERSIDWVWWSSGIVLALLIDSYVDAKLSDMDFNIENFSHSGSGGVSLSFHF